MEAVPFLVHGSGPSPDKGGCIMQIVSWVATRAWTDEPACVNVTLCQVAIEVNDTVNDQERQKLLDLAPRLMGTAEVDDRGVTLFTPRDNEIADHLYEYFHVTLGGEYSVTALVELLDEYDEFTGRKSEPGLLDYAELCALQQSAPA